MLRFAGSVPLATLVLLAVTVRAQEKPKLVWKFKDGQTFYQKQSLDFKNVTSYDGKDINVSGNETWYFAWTFVRQNQDKTWQVRLKLLAITLNMDIGGEKIGLDTTGKPEDDTDLTRTFRGFIGNEFTLTIQPDGQIQKFEGFKEAMDRLAKKAPTQIETLRKFITEDSIKQWTAIVLGGLPGKEVGKGEAWTTKTVMAMNPIGKVNTINTFTTDNDGKVKVKLASQVELAKDADLGMGVKVTKADLKPVGSGVLEYDSVKGRLKGGEINFSLTGTLSVASGDQTAEFKMNQSVKMSTRFLDKNPLLEQ